MKKPFVYTAIAALATLSLMPHNGFAQEQSFTISVESQDGTPVVPAPPAPPASVSITTPARIDDSYVYTLSGYDTLSGMNSVAALEQQLVDLDRAIANARNDETKKKLQADRDSRLKSLNFARRLVPFSKLVDVKFDNATMKQAAEALSRASGVRIEADNSIPDSTRVTVEARKIRLSTVLESVARQSGLVIDPINRDGKGDLGAMLTQPPLLRVNDKVVRSMPSPSPWSDAWDVSPTNRYIINLGNAAGFGVLNGARSLESLGSYANGMKNYSATQGLKGFSTSGPLTAWPTTSGARSVWTTNGETTVILDGGKKLKIAKDGTLTIIEPGKNDKGEDGYWTTVYVNKQDGLTQDKKTWSKTQ